MALCRRGGCPKLRCGEQVAATPNLQLVTQFEFPNAATLTERSSRRRRHTHLRLMDARRRCVFAARTNVCARCTGSMMDRLTCCLCFFVGGVAVRRRASGWINLCVCVHFKFVAIHLGNARTEISECCLRNIARACNRACNAHVRTQNMPPKPRG